MAPDGSFDVVLWDVAARRLVHRWRLPANQVISYQNLSLAWTGDSRTVAVESAPGSVSFYDAASGRQTSSVTVPGAGADTVATYPAGNDVVAIAEGTRTAILVDPKTAHIVRRVKLPIPDNSAGAAVSHTAS
jgi:hypothetical protein